MIKIDFQTAAHLPKSKRKRRKCFPVVYNLLYAANRSQQEGFLAIEPLIFRPPYSIDLQNVEIFFKTALQSAVDGVKEDDIIRFSNTVLSTKEYKDYELLSLILVAEGALSIRRQESPDILYNLLVCWIGIDLQDEVDKLLADALELLKTQKQLLEVDVLETFFSNQDQNVQPGKLDKLLRKLDKPISKDLICKCGRDNFAHALLTCQKETVVNIFKQMGSSWTSSIQNAIRKVHPFTSVARQKKAVQYVLSSYTKVKKERKVRDKSGYILTEHDLKDLASIDLDDL